MSYIDKNLMDGEQIIFRTKLHWIVYLGPIVLFALGIIFMSRAKESAPFAVFFFLFSIIWAISSIVSRKTSEFGVSNKRVLIVIS